MNPGAGASSLDQPPPSSCLFSKMPTFRPPYFWRYMPATRALLPPPTITTSKLLSAIVSFLSFLIEFLYLVSSNLCLGRHVQTQIEGDYLVTVIALRCRGHTGNGPGRSSSIQTLDRGRMPGKFRNRSPSPRLTGDLIYHRPVARGRHISHPCAVERALGGIADHIVPGHIGGDLSHQVDYKLSVVFVVFHPLLLR